MAGSPFVLVPAAVWAEETSPKRLRSIRGPEDRAKTKSTARKGRVCHEPTRFIQARDAGVFGEDYPR